LLQLGPFSNNYKKVVKAIKELNNQNNLMTSLKTNFKKAQTLVESDTQDEKIRSDN
jgi:hypothetical protein